MNGFASILNIHIFRMDSLSGSLKHSTACSPIMPGSPDPTDIHRPTSPHIISQAVENIQSGIYIIIFRISYEKYCLYVNILLFLQH